jgi:hypothetical protein
MGDIMIINGKDKSKRFCKMAGVSKTIVNIMLCLVKYEKEIAEKRQLVLN